MNSTKRNVLVGPMWAEKSSWRVFPTRRQKAVCRLQEWRKAAGRPLVRGEKERRNAFLAHASEVCGQLRLQAVRFWSWRDLRPDSMWGTRRDKLCPSGTQCDKPHYSTGGWKNPLHIVLKWEPVAIAMAANYAYWAGRALRSESSTVEEYKPKPGPSPKIQR